MNRLFLRKSIIISQSVLRVLGRRKFCEISQFMNTGDMYSDVKEPEDYRTIFLENLPQEWSEPEIKVRLEQTGPISKIHLVKDSIGLSTGRVLAVYTKIEFLSAAISAFREKTPFDKPVKIRFFREFQNKRKLLSADTPSNVLLIKNLPEHLKKSDLKLFLSEFKEPIHISYLRDHENEFERRAMVYFVSSEDAQNVLKFANLRYVMNKQMFIQFSHNHFDFADFRTRIELGIKLEPRLEMMLMEKQMIEFKRLAEEKNKGILAEKDKEKLEYLMYRKRRIEYSLRVESREKLLESNQNTKPTKKLFKKKENQISFNEDRSIVYLNSNKYFKQ